MLLLCENFNHLTLEDIERYTVDNIDKLFHAHAVIDSGNDTVQSSRYLSFVPEDGYADYEYRITRNMPDSRRVIGGFLISQDRKNWYEREYRDAPDWVYTDLPLTVKFTLLHSNTSLFEVTCTMSRYNMSIAFDNYGNGEIAGESSIPIDLGYMVYLEIYVDTAGAEGGDGQVKIAVNGKTVCDLTDVVTSAVDTWSGDPTNLSSWVNKIQFWIYRPDDRGPYPVLDGFYLCNEGMAYHDDFLGPMMITTLYPGQPGDQASFVPYIDKEKADTVEYTNAEILASNELLNFTALDNNYLEADDANVRELFYLNNDLWREGQQYDIVAVQHKTYAKRFYANGNDEFEYDIFPVFKASGNDIVSEKTSSIHLNEQVYKELSIAYDVVPNLAVPWTWELLNNAQFGFQTRFAINHLFLDEDLNLSENITDE